MQMKTTGNKKKPFTVAFRQIIGLVAVMQVWWVATCCNSSTQHIDDNKIKVWVESYYTVMSNRNWDEYRKFFFENGTITTIWQTPQDKKAEVHVISIDEFIEQTPNGPDSKPIFSETMTSFEVEQRGDLAVVWAGYHATFGDEQEVMEWDGTDVFTLMRWEGQWRIVSLAFIANE